MSRNDRSFLQTALDLGNKARAAAHIVKAALAAGLKGAAVAVVQESLPFLVKVIIGLIIATVILPLLMLSAMPNMFFGYENADAEEQITLREQALSIGGAYMSLETFEQTYRDSVEADDISEPSAFLHLLRPAD